MFVEDHIYTKARELIAQATGLTISWTLDGVFGYAGFGSILHPGHSVIMGILEVHPWPG